MAKGSILGPLLLVMFISDLPLQVQTRIDIFADDTTLMATSNYGNLKELENALSFGIFAVYEWATYNQLPLNCYKTNNYTN